MNSSTGCFINHRLLMMIKHSCKFFILIWGIFLFNFYSSIIFLFSRLNFALQKWWTIQTWWRKWMWWWWGVKWVTNTTLCLQRRKCITSQAPTVALYLSSSVSLAMCSLWSSGRKKPWAAPLESTSLLKLWTISASSFSSSSPTASWSWLPALSTHTRLGFSMRT